MSEPASAFVAALGWALVHFLWQGLAIGLAAAVLLMLLRNARPQARYAVACVALAACVAWPAFGLLRSLFADASSVAPLFVADTAAPAAGAEIFVVPLDSWRTLLQTRLPWIVSLWSLGAALLALRMALGMAWIGRIRRAHEGSVDAGWQARLDRLAERFGLRRKVALRVADELDSPVAAGWWRPIVLVPAALIARMPPDLLEALLAHELAHVKRYDYLVNLVQSAIEALLFYHPVVWWLSKRIRAERECIADELAAQALGEPKRLALALQRLDLIRDAGGFPQPTALVTQFAPAAHGGNLMSRIQRLVRPDRHALSWKVALPILGLSAICLTVFAQGQAPSAKAATDQPKLAAAAADQPKLAAAAADQPKLAAASVDQPKLAAVAADRPKAAPAAAPSAEPAPSRSVRTQGSIVVGGNSDRGPREAYALVRADKDAMTVSGNVNDIREADKAKRSLQGDFLWFRRGDKSYVVQDPAALARVAEAWKPSEALGAKMSALGGQMETHNKKMQALGTQMEALSATADKPNAEMERTSSQMEAVSRQQEALSDKMQALSVAMSRADSDRERDALDAKMRALDTQMRPLSEKMQALSQTMNEHAVRIQASQRPMEELGQRMEEASKPMDALGKQMDALGKQQEKLSREADRVVRSVIDEALSSGKALPMMSKLN